MALGLDLFAERIRAALGAALGVPAADLKLEAPKLAEHGELAFPCFAVAKKRGVNPAALAAELAASLGIDDVATAAAGPFLNFRVERVALAREVLAEVAAFRPPPRGETVVIDFSSPNIAKPMHVGHLRSTVIGAALSRIFAALGWRVVRINHLGDWGSQFGKLVAAWRRWGSEAALAADPIQHLLDLYVRYHAEEAADPTLAASAQEAFLELESGRDGSVRQAWKHFTEVSLQAFQKVYDRLGVQFDFVRGESWYEDQLEDTLAWLENAGVLEQSAGATIVDLASEGIKTPCLVKTAHGTTLYATRDLAAARSRWQEFRFAHALYVVGGEQRMHFEQLKAVLRRAGCPWADRLEHVPFGLVRLVEGKLSTREGRVLLLADVLDRAVELARGIVAEKNPDHPDPARAAEEIGVGAVVFHDLKHQRAKDVVFDWKEVLSFEGDTGPYLQYTHARCCAILRKAARPAPDPHTVDCTLLADAGDLMVALGRFPAALREAADKREPMLLAQQLLRIAAAGNAFYRDRRVLGSERPLEDARLAAIAALRARIAHGLALLGVPAPAEM